MVGELAQINETTIAAQYGPMRLSIQAWGRNGPDAALAMEAGKYSFGLLPRLVPARDLFRRDLCDFEALEANYQEPLFNAMIRAAKMSGHRDLGPMAAVAGVVAETVMDFLREAGAVKAIVENGGDLAIHLDPGQTAAVGVRLGLREIGPSRKLILSGDLQSSWGVCSSGLGGRSLTRGIADTALCVAASAAMADAAATALGNEATVDSPAIKQTPAEILREDTDIRGLYVTESVGELAPDEIGAALERGLAYAHRLVDSQMILGALISLGGQVRLTDNFARNIAQLIHI